MAAFPSPAEIVVQLGVTFDRSKICNVMLRQQPQDLLFCNGERYPELQKDGVKKKRKAKILLRVSSGEKGWFFHCNFDGNNKTPSTVKGRTEKGNVIRKDGIFGSVKSPISFPNYALFCCLNN